MVGDLRVWHSPRVSLESQHMRTYSEIAERGRTGGESGGSGCGDERRLVS